MNRKITFCLIITFLLANFAAAALNVPTPTYPTIQYAISVAIDGDEIIVADGNYTPPNADGFDFGGKLITLKSQNGPLNCIINCNNTRRAFYFHNGETSAAKIEGFTIKNGNAYYGGAIECEIVSSPTINNCIITNNTAVYGGAIDCFYYSSPVINNCIIANNAADLDGGAVECSAESSPVIKNCLVVNNTAQGYGGAIDCYDISSPPITNCTIVNNTGDAARGGVHAMNGSMPTIRNSILWNNGDDIYGTTATYSCIQDGDTGTGNIKSNPQFKTGPYPSNSNYYLSQTAAGQLPGTDSNCVNRGRGVANDDNDTNMPDAAHRVTRTDNVPDSGTVDMGFHYPKSSDANYVLITAVDPNESYGTIRREPNLPSYKQFADVRLDANAATNRRIEKWNIDGNDVNDVNATRVITMDSNHTVTVKFGPTIYYLTTYVIGGNGTISPKRGYQPAKETVTLFAAPDYGYKVKQWTGTDNNSLTTLTNTVTMTSNRTVTVEFNSIPQYILTTTAASGASIDPNYPAGYSFSENTVVQLTATLPAGTIPDWNGTNNDQIHTLTNTVTMTGNRNVYLSYHISQHTLITTAAAGATIDPYYPTGSLINENTVVQLTATIPTGTVVVWSGTNDNNSISTLNTVTMDANRSVSVNYRTPRVLHVPGQYTTITSAVSAAASGDKIIVSQRIGNPYREANINLGSKRLTITSEHPDDPCCVEATVLDCQNAGRAFIIRGGNKDPNHVVIDGFTIINGSAIYNPQNPTNASGHGQDGSDANGGAIVCYGGASPTISNCIFRNCTAEGQKGENATYVYSVLPDQDAALETPATPGQSGSNGRNGIDGADGYDGGDGGDAYGGALFFDANGSPRILHCQFINCFALGGNAGFGGQGQDGQDGQDGQPGAGGVVGNPNGGDGGDGGVGGDGGKGGNGGNGGNATGGAIYFAGNNNAVIQYCEIIECNAIPGLGNVAGNGSGAGNSGANAGNGGTGAGGGGGAEGGSNGANGNGGAGGIGGYGGNGGTNGDATAGGICFGNNCIIQMSDTNFIGNHTTTKVASFEYDAGNGGNGGDGGAGGGDTGNSGIGGRGGDAGSAGNAGDGIYIGDGANGGIGGDGGGSGSRQARGGNGGNGSYGATGGNGGIGGAGNPDGSDGSDGADVIHGWLSMTSLAGCNYYGHGCTVTLNNCSFLKNHTDEEQTSQLSDGGAEYYDYDPNGTYVGSTIKMNNCTFSENSAGAAGDGGAQLFIWRNNIDINNCTYNKNTSVGSGGAVFAGEDVNLTVIDSSFLDNVASNSGGAIFVYNYNYPNKTVSITDSYFTNNESGFGGGLYWFDNDTNNTTTITDCVFTENSADHGGGIYWSEGVPTISGCIFNRNHANGRWALLNYNWIYDEFFGGGGAIFGFASDGIIKDCTITDNTTSGSGGGIYIGGEQIDPNRHPQINNCLIAGNSAVLDGGGIISYWFASPQITNCTIAENIAYDPADAGHGRGGGISCSYESNTTMTNCILWGNKTFRSNHGNQIAIGNNNDPEYLQRPAELTITYSDIQNWSDANQIYVFPGRTLNLDANNVMDNDPCFVQTYFLASTSPCIDEGSADANFIGLSTYTTQIDNSFDTNIVDIGYHYALHSLTIVVIGPGSVRVDEPNHYDPNTGTYRGSVFGLIATPDDGYRVQSWTGTDISPAWNFNTNTVTMTGDKVVTVEFEVNYNRTIDVAGDVMGIQKAIDQARDGDTIRIHPGTYVGTGFVVDRKNITIRGEPLNPGAVIIDCAGEAAPLYTQPKGFVLIGDNQHSVTLNGLSIINSDTTVLRWDIGDVCGVDGRPTKADRDVDDARANYGGAITIQGNHTVRNCIIRNCAVRVSQSSGGNPGGDPNAEDTPVGGQNGGDGGFGGNVGGAGIYIQWGDANIINVTIEDCYAIGGDANNGAKGYEDMNDAYPAGISGIGGDGGNVFGAGILIRSGKPHLENVIVRNCVGRAGNGGNGAVGAINTAGGDGGLPGRVKGAGIYCSTTSEPVFVNCTVENCRAYGGRGGNGGDGGEFVDTEPPTQGGYGGLTTESAAGQGDIRMFSSNGGAVFCEDESRAKFTHCAFVGNRTYGSISGIGGLWHLPADWQEQPRQHYRLPSFGAGIFCSTASDVAFNGCHFENNRTAYNQDFNDSNYLAAVDINDINDYNGDLIGFGGGLCLWYTFTTEINECNFVLNSAPLGGGIHSTSSDIYINDCNVINNISTAGGGILALDSTGTISKSIIKGNTAGTQTGYYGDTSTALFGTGGGIYALDSLVDINDTVITENYARFTGAGICLDGDTPYPVRPSIKNCLITANTATQVGGGIAAIYFAEPNIQNCTIAKNIASDVNGSGGGLFASYAADVIVRDSIFWANSGVDGSQIALTKGGSTDRPAKLVVKYSDIDLRTGTDFNSLLAEPGTGTGTTTGVLVDSQTINNEITASGSAKVIVSLVEPAGAQTTNWSSPASVSSLRSQIATLQNQVLSTFSTGEWTLRHKLTNAAIFSGQVTQAGLNKLMSNPSVAHIEPVRTLYPALAQGIPLMNASDTRDIYNGSGVSVAIVDTGVDYTHPRLGGGGFPNNKVIGGYDTGNNDNDPIPVGVAHGTSCAGLAAGSLGTVGDYIGGVAYNAKIYALKASPDNAGYFFGDALLAAWDWCITHQNDNTANPIKVINNSWGVPGYPINNSAVADAYSPAFTTAAQTAVDAGITILAASGNDGFAGDGISWPSAMSNVISVGAVYDAAFISPACGVQTQPDQVTCYSNTADILDILASSENAYTTDIVGAGGYDSGDYFPYFNGTSAACPYAAGAVAALQNAAMQLRGEYLTPSEVRTLLKITGDSVTDTKVAITKPRVNLGSAISLLSQAVPIYRQDTSCTITGLAQDANGNWIVDDYNNIAQDPNFVLEYYLSYTNEALQDFNNSPCFDIGSNTAVNLGLNTYTTRADGVKDTNIVDLGYHYFTGAATFDLRIEVNGVNLPSSCTVAAPYEPNQTHKVYANTIARLHAISDANYHVVMWLVDDGNTARPNITEYKTRDRYFNVLMDKPKKVVVEFEKYTQRNIIVPDEFASIQDAINDAEDGDTIYIYRKTDGRPYYITEPNGLDFKGKAITLRSENPNDPNVVAATVIDCNYAGRAFIFRNGEDANSIIEGLTIINSLAAGIIAQQADASYGANGRDATGDGFGGAIFIGRNTSPTIRYCVFSNCEVAGGIGSDGRDGYNLAPDDTRERGGSGGNGGNGYGNGCGGAIFCDQNSSPTILVSIISNSYARGGIGGSGGNGGTGSTSKIGGDGGNGGNGSGRGYGGAIYVAANAKPKIVGCSFIENIASMGLGGQGGRQGAGQIPDSPPYAYDGSDGSSSGAGLSGAIYYEEGATVDINDCNFINNTIEAGTTGAYDTDGGAIYCEPNCAGISILKTNLTGNKATGGSGGAIKFGPKNNIKLADCYFGGNIADGNGGALMIGVQNDTNICRLDVNNCAFTDNIATNGVGGAIMAVNFDANFIDCYINRNTAQAGGGLHWTSNVSAARIHGGTIMENKAIGTNAEGGGAYISNLPIEIINCLITGNSSLYSGGGIMLKGPGTTTSKVHNCLFAGNSANARGGAIFVSLYSSPTITSCTFSENGCESGGAGGAIFYAYGSSPTIKDCLFDNTKRVAIYANSADCNSNISYCLFNKNTAGDFYYHRTGRTYDTNHPDDANVNLTALNNATDGNNIAGNPQFLKSDLGNYYLSQTPPNSSQSPAVHHGSSPAVNVNVLPDDNMADYTTRTDSNDANANTGDTGLLDIGFHYIDVDLEANRPRRFQLTTTVLGGHGGIEPPSGWYYAGTTIEVNALPDAGWRVNGWTGTDDDSTTNTTNYVVMIRNRDVMVSFEQPQNLFVPNEYQSIQHAINAAKNGDKIILAKGTYYGHESNLDITPIYIIGKNITITSTNPDDPCVVAQTIIQGARFRIVDVDRTMVLDGITIQDANWYGGDPDCDPAADAPTGDGPNGNSIFGGAMAIHNSSPTIRNCRFVNGTATGSNGCDGTGTRGDGGWAGFAWGGAVGIDSTSNPIFKNCQFINCAVYGGDGGNGSSQGHGGNWGDPNGNVYHSWDWADGLGPNGGYADYWYYSGYGGAIYCMGGSKPEFEKCLFRGNRSYGGVCGLSGSGLIPEGWPELNYAIDTFGGAVYIAAGSESKFIDCNFVDNEADTRNQVGPNDVNYTDDYVLDNNMVSYGGAICAQGTTIPTFKGCTFNNNRACAGGGIYWEDSTARISRCTFENCSAMLGGAVSLIDSNSILFECDFSGNQAIDPVGQGGAIYSASSASKFYDCEFNANIASTSGGGAYFAGELEPNMHNCLIIYNNAGRDGGGVSANWDTQLSLSNCTFSQNNATGNGFMTSFGGGLSCAYQANTKIINSIFWNNRADYGPEISIGSNFDAADKQIAEVAISYSDVKGGAASIFTDVNCILNWDYASNLSGTSLESPLFVIGYWGGFYLSQTISSAPNDVNSLCVDAGFDTAINNDMYRHTTRKDNVIDIADSNVDMGYHYTLTAEILGDFNFDGIVDITDAALFYEYWMNTGCDFPYFCHERDITEDGEVDFEDFAAFAENYGLIETTPPKPDPMTWASKPRSATATSITMTATAAKDNSGSQVKYYFDCYSGNCHDSNWITSATYTDSALATGAQYGYRVKAKDARNNETGWSVIGYAIAGEDDTPPQPDPMTWAVAPYATSSSSIRMIATSATDACAIEYYFDCYSGNCHDSNWQSTTVYADLGLEPNTTYTYRVQARDKSPAQNTTQFSEPNWATTWAQGGEPNGPNEPNGPDLTPPTYTPTTAGLWVLTPHAVYDYNNYYWYHSMTAVAATDTSLPLTYWFKCVSGSGSDGYITTIGGVEVTYITGGWTGPNPAAYRVRITDAAGNYVESTIWDTETGQQ